MSTSSGPQKATGAKRGPKRQKTNGDTEDKPVGNGQPGTSNDGFPNQHRIPISLLNPYITCSLCKGYFIDAVTVMDCLHTFCKSCLIKYFEDHNDCPTCHNLIHQSHPTHYVSFDRTLQEIVYKLVPGLQAEEHRRRHEFMEERRRLGLPTGDESDSSDEEKRCTKKQKRMKSGRGGLAGSGATRNGGTARNGVCGAKMQVEKEQLNGDEPPPPELNGDLNKQCCTEADAANAHHRKDEAALIHLIPADSSNNPIPRQYIRVSVFATINTLKRTLAFCLKHGDISHYNDYDIFCNNELMGRDYSILFIQKTRWRDHSPDEPIKLVYKKHKEL